MKTPIQFTVKHDGHVSQFETYPYEYRNLMVLLRDNFSIDSFGECGGMGRCATCIIKAINIKGDSIIRERNEPVTLSKMGYHDPSFRLSCQLNITADLQNAEIEIIDSY